MSHPILHLLPDEVRALGFEQELAAEERRLDRDERNGDIGKLIHLTENLRDLLRDPVVTTVLKVTRRKN